MSLSLMLLLGGVIFGGMGGAWLCQKLHFPQVVGYIIIGVLIGNSGFNIIHLEDVANLKPLNYFALGIIGFLVGGELKLEIFRKYAKQFTAILLCEGLAAFLLVGLAAFGIVYYVSGQVLPALAAGLIFGAISSATDPASTMDVIWEYRAKGVMTTAIIAIVALDDALAMTLYGISTGAAQILAGDGAQGGQLIAQALWSVAVELGGSLVLGALFALALVFVLKLIKQIDRMAALIVGVIMLAIGMAVKLQLDVILASMAIGFVLVNLAPVRSEAIFKLIRSFSIPIYVIFFVLVGAQLSLSAMPVWLWGLVAAYIVLRNAGKVFGSYCGARLTNAAVTTRKYLGFGIFAQGGVAIGLAMVAGENLSNLKVGGLAMSDAVVYVVTSTTLLLQLIGPPMVKFAVKASDEAGRNVTEEDVMTQMTVRDMVGGDPRPLRESDSIAMAAKVFTRHDLLVYPVVTQNNELCGVITFDALKDVLSDRDTWNWLLVADVMYPVNEVATTDEVLKDAYDRMRQLHLDQMPIVAEDDIHQVLGILDVRSIRQKVQGELLHNA